MGVDIKPQPHYCGDEFYQADALTFPLEGYDAYWASPPCQAYSINCQQWRKVGYEYPDLIETIRKRLIETGIPYIIENVPRSPLKNPVKLNGAMFGLRVQRNRLFECSFNMPLCLLPQGLNPVKTGRPVKEGDVISPVGHFPNRAYAEKEMGIDWMTKQELTQAIPPAYSEFIGKEMIKYV